MELKDYIRVIRRRLGWFVAVMVIVVGGYAAVATVTQKRVYRTTARLIISPTRTASLLQEHRDFFPNGAKMNFETRVASLDTQEITELAALYLLDLKVGDAYMFAEQRAEADAMLDTLREGLVQSYVQAHPDKSPDEIRATFGEEIDKALNAKLTLDPRTGQWEGTKGRWQEECAKLVGTFIQRSFTLSKMEKTQIVEITVQADSSHKVIAMANALCDAAILYNAQFDSRELQEAAKQARRMVQDNQKDMARLRDDLKEYWKTREVSTKDFYTSEQFYALLNKLHRDIEEIDGQIEQKDKERENLDKKRTLDNKKYPQFGLPSDSQLSGLLKQRNDEEKRLDALRERYTDAHPEVKKTQRNIEDLKRRYADELRKFQENQIYDYQYQLAVLESEKEALREEALRKRALLKDYDEKRLKVDQFRLDEQEMLNRLSAYENENRRLLEFLGGAELFGDIPVKPVERWGNPRELKDAFEMVADTQSMMWFMFVVALLLSLGVVFLVEYMDTTLKTEHDIRRHLNLPVLGIIHHQREGESVLLTELPTKDPFAEKFYTAATILKSAAQDLNLKTFVVSSTIPKEGKTTISLNLGVALARKGLRVILVDSDLRIPQIHELLGVDNAYGLSSVLEGRLKAREVLADISSNPASAKKAGLESFLHQTNVENLRVLTSGPIPPDPLNLLESVRMKALIEELKGMADFVLLDTPPLANVGDTLTLATICDAAVFVVGAGAVEQHQVTWAKHLLSNIEANVLGVFLNHATIEGRSYYYYYNEYKSYRSRG